MHVLQSGLLELFTVIYVEVWHVVGRKTWPWLGCSLVTCLAANELPRDEAFRNLSLKTVTTSDSCTGNISHRPSLQLADSELNACSLGCQGHIACLFFASEFAIDSGPFHQATFTYVHYLHNQQQIHQRTFYYFQG